MTARQLMFLLLLLPTIAGIAQGQGRLADSAPRELAIFLLIGQSNMAGRAEIEAQDRDTLQNVYLFSGASENPWVKASNPLNRYSTVRKDISMQKLGPGYAFARAMEAALKPQTIGLVVNAKGGTAISEWMPGSLLYKEAISRTRSAMEWGSIKGILWHQGASDAGKNQHYMENLVVLIQALRADLDSPRLPFIAGELGESSEARKAFNTMMEQLPQHVPYTALVSADSLKAFDGVHFDAAGQRVLGKRYADLMITMIK